MNQKRLIIVISIGIVITASIALLGSSAINQRTEQNLNPINQIENILKNLETDNYMYSGDQFTDTTSDLEMNSVINDKEDALNEIDGAINEINSLSTEGSSDFNIDFGDL